MFLHIHTSVIYYAESSELFNELTINILDVSLLHVDGRIARRYLKSKQTEDRTSTRVVINVLYFIRTRRRRV